MKISLSLYLKVFKPKVSAMFTVINKQQNSALACGNAISSYASCVDCIIAHSQQGNNNSVYIHVKRQHLVIRMFSLTVNQKYEPAGATTMTGKCQLIVCR